MSWTALGDPTVRPLQSIFVFLSRPWPGPGRPLAGAQAAHLLE